MSKFVVSARKYRPTTFDEVIGQAHVAKTLKNALQTDQLAHAFLFCGPRGVGKTTCARILAKVINCSNTQDKVNPCNDCSSCKSFNENASFNIIELDAASNNSVEHIRTLIEQVRFQPQQGTHKVFIIDEVHMLSSQAFNAFLKTLEEPPPYAIFILATTEKHKIIPTILSRCQIFDFKRIQVQDAADQLKSICDKEGRTADAEALHLIGQKADGAMRDALSIFDKIASAAGEHITYKDVITNLNILDYDYYFKVVDAFLREDLSDALLIMDEVVRAGFEPDQFIQGLADHMRDLLVAKDARTHSLLDVSEGLKERYMHQAALTKKSVLLTGLDILNQCDIALPRAKNKRLYTEIALSKINFSNRAIETNIFGSSAPSQEKKTKVVNETPSPKPQITKTSTINTATKANESYTTKTVSTPHKKESQPDSENQSTKITHSSQNPIDISNNPKNTSHSENQNETKVNIKPPQNDLLNIKKPSGIDALLASVKQEEADLEEAKKGLNQDTLEKLWKKYSASHSSPSVRSMLDIAIYNLNEKTIEITLPSNHYVNMLMEENELKEMLRAKMGTPDLLLNPEVNKEAFPDIQVEKPRVLLSSKEKFNLMAEQSPALIKLVKTLDLKPDSGADF